jgi:hypothetical protein
MVKKQIRGFLPQEKAEIYYISDNRYNDGEGIMTFKQIVFEQNLTGYRLSKLSGVPQMIIIDLISGKADVLKCNAFTLYKISKALGLTMESLIDEVQKKEEAKPLDFDVFRSNICHILKTQGDKEFVMKVEQSGEIQKLIKEPKLAQGLYILALVDYLSRINGLPLNKEYERFRKLKLLDPIYPVGILIYSKVLKNPQTLEEAKKNAIPEFKRFNIMEGNIRDVE